jgi:hypothetical protein
MDKEFNEHGVIVKRVYGNVYEVKNKKKKRFLRHISQLKGIGEGGCNGLNASSVSSQ